MIPDIPIVATLRARGLDDATIAGLLSGAIVPVLTQEPASAPVQPTSAPAEPASVQVPANFHRELTSLDEFTAQYGAYAQASGLLAPTPPPPAARPQVVNPFDVGPDGRPLDAMSAHCYARRAAEWGQTLAGIASLAPMPAAPIAAPVAVPQLGDTPGHVTTHFTEVTFRNK